MLDSRGGEIACHQFVAGWPFLRTPLTLPVAAHVFLPAFNLRQMVIVYRGSPHFDRQVTTQNIAYLYFFPYKPT